jgi:hypothetical protein
MSPFSPCPDGAIVRRLRRFFEALMALAALAGCATDPGSAGLSSSTASPNEVRSRLLQLLPPTVTDRAGWAADLQVAFTTLGLPTGPEPLCAAIAVIEQESGFQADPPVANLPRIAWAEIDRRAEALGVPGLLVRGALQLPSKDGRSYADRLDAVKTERELSRVFEDLIDAVPLGRRLFASHNPVRTGGPMQVAIHFAERHAGEQPYPYAIGDDGSVRREVFTRRGGVYFGVAHLLAYPAPEYDRPIYRFADFNAGRWASRNAAFQQAVSRATGIALALDGDLLTPGAEADRPGATEAAVRQLLRRQGFDDGDVRSALAQGDRAGFSGSRLYRRVFELAEQAEGRPLPRAVLPRIALRGPKISRPLTTEWFANRVDERHRRCLARGL